MKDNPCRIIIADDHAVVRTGLQLILDETSDMEIVDEAKDGQELLDKLRANSYDLVILDVSMPGKDSMEVLKEIKTQWEALPVVIFSMNPDDIYAIRMIKNGASAYINKETKPRHIFEALRTVIGGKKYFFPRQLELLAEMVSAPDKTDTMPHLLLTDRENQIFIMLATGVKKTEIADKLGISIHTLSNHRNNIMKKMNMSGNSELTRYAIQNGIIQ
jgi:two-component system invasion response regulator UvrY